MDAVTETEQAANVFAAKLGPMCSRLAEDNDVLPHVYLAALQKVLMVSVQAFARTHLGPSENLAHATAEGLRAVARDFTITANALELEGFEPVGRPQ